MRRFFTFTSVSFFIASFITAALSSHAETSVFFDANATLGAPPAPWRVQGIPGKANLLTQFEVLEQNSNFGVKHALRISADKSYAVLVHPIAAAAQPKTLIWSWRVAKFAEGADIRRKSTDDSALKVCVLFDMPIERVPFFERTLLRYARSATKTDLPAATLCYLWDNQLPKDTLVANAYTKRLRYIVLQSGVDAQWHREERNIAKDFERAFGEESKTLPTISSIAIGADADNTQSTSTAYVADLKFQ